MNLHSTTRTTRDSEPTYNRTFHHYRDVLLPSFPFIILLTPLSFTHFFSVFSDEKGRKVTLFSCLTYHNMRCSSSFTSGFLVSPTYTTFPGTHPTTFLHSTTLTLFPCQIQLSASHTLRTTTHYNQPAPPHPTTPALPHRHH